MTRQYTARFGYIKKLLHSTSHSALFIIVVAATFYPIASAFVFGRSINNSVDSRKVLAANIEKPAPSQTGVFRNGVVTITFDDGWLSTYENGLPILDEMEFMATFYILSDSFNDPQYMSLGQAKSLQDRGHQIGSHTVSHAHLPDLSEFDLQYEVEGSQRQLESKLGPIVDFASPYGEYSDETLDEIRANYRSHRNVSNGINTFENFDIWQLKSPNIVVSTPNEDVRSLLAQAKERKGWIILTYHEINDSGRKYSITPSLFREQMQLVKDSGMPVATIAEVLQEVEQVYGTP